MLQEAWKAYKIPQMAFVVTLDRVGLLQEEEQAHKVARQELNTVMKLCRNKQSFRETSESSKEDIITTITDSF